MCSSDLPGPHGWWSVEDATGREVFDDGSAGAEYSPTCSIADRDFLVAARADVPALLAEVERLTRELQVERCGVRPVDEQLQRVTDERDELLVRVANADAELRATREAYSEAVRERDEASGEVKRIMHQLADQTNETTRARSESTRLNSSH